MSSRPCAIFLIHLVQDVNVLRPLAFMATRDFGFDALLLVSTKFTARDTLGIWQHEIEEISAQCGARVEYFDDDWEVQSHLTGRGLLFSASESHLQNHATTHDVFRHAPPAFLKVTVQHGFECVGFRHSADHERAHGKSALFAADIVCSWTSADRLPSMAPSQLRKLLVTGPTTVLQLPECPLAKAPGAPGIVCENLHSVRFSGTTDFKSEFVAVFDAFSRRMRKRKRDVRLRAHPGGQYFLRNSLAVPSNVKVENAPMYRLDLRQFSYGISAPSTVLVDMLLARIPTAVWRDSAGTMDTSSYEGLAIVSSARDWEKFALAAEAHPEPFIAAQEKFLEDSGMILDPHDVFSRFAQLFEAAARMDVRKPGSVAERQRLLFITNGGRTGLQDEFERVLAPLIARGEVTTMVMTAPDLEASGGKRNAPRLCLDLDRTNPSVIVICDYRGPAAQRIIEWARGQDVPVITSGNADAPNGGGKILSNPAEDRPWPLDLLVNNVDERLAISRRTLPKAKQSDSPERRREQLLDLLQRAQEVVREQRDQAYKNRKVQVCHIQ